MLEKCNNNIWKGQKIEKKSDSAWKAELPDSLWHKNGMLWFFLHQQNFTEVGRCKLSEKLN